MFFNSVSNNTTDNIFKKEEVTFSEMQAEEIKVNNNDIEPEETKASLKQRLKKSLMEQIDFSRDQSDDEIKDLIDELLLQEKRKGTVTLRESLKLHNELFHSIRKLDMLQELVDDPSVTEIMINGPDNVFVEQKGALRKLEGHFESEEKLGDVIQQIVASCNRMVNESSPIVDARLENGSRVNVVLKPIALNGPIVTIRRFPENPITMEKLLSFGSITEEATEFLRKLVEARYNIFISGANRIIGLSQMTFRKQRVQTT